MAAKKVRRSKDPFTDAEELMLLRELRVAASAMFEADVTQDGKQFHFDWKRTNKMRSALLHAQILQLARAASQAPGPAPGNASKGDGE